MRLDVRLLGQARVALHARLRYLLRWLPRWRRRPSLARRLLGLLLGGMVVIFLIVNIALRWASTRLLDDSLQKQAAQWVTELDDLGTPHYASGTAQHLDIIDKHLQHFPQILFVRYFDATGQEAIGRYGTLPAAIAPNLSAQQMQAARNPGNADSPYLVTRAAGRSDSPYLRIVAPVSVRSLARGNTPGFGFGNESPEHVRVIGYIDMGVNAAYYHQELSKSLAFGGELVAIMLLLALVVGRLLVRRWLVPLVALSVPLRRLAQGDTSVHVESRGGYTEIAAISEAVMQLQQMAEHDALTGLVNRARFMRAVENELERLRESRTRSALYFIDLDQFKYVNDTLGHAAGDRLLAQIADALRRRLREADVISRLGGDEFAVLAHDVSVGKALEIANSILQLVQGERIVAGDRAFNSGCSIGITMIGGGDYSVEDLLAQADMTCYAAKARGRNTVEVYQPSNQEERRMSADLHLAQLVKEALREGRFELHYQIMSGLAWPNESYYEVLLRMQARDHQTIAPSAFLPSAERFGLLLDIDRWVVEHALRTLAMLRRKGHDVRFSINLSGQSLGEDSLPDFIQEQLARNGLAGKDVMFEITEQTAVRHLKQGRRMIESLMDSGCHIALDDFGVGFSSFGYLKNLPADFIKIDGAFVQHMSEDVIDQTMVQCIIRVAKALGKSTVAESVPDQKTVNMLREFGVDFVQGYYIGRPSQRLVLVPQRAAS